MPRWVLNSAMRRGSLVLTRFGNCHVLNTTTGKPDADDISQPLTGSIDPSIDTVRYYQPPQLFMVLDYPGKDKVFVAILLASVVRRMKHRVQEHGVVQTSAGRRTKHRVQKHGVVHE